MEKWAPEWKQQQLDQLYKKWKDCELCTLSETRDKVVFGVGNPDADILFIGEAPGSEENKKGAPFVGESGRLLMAMLKGRGIERDDVYLTNIVGCQPPKNRNPLIEEREACLQRVHDIVYIIDPLVIVPVGKFALKALAKGRDWSILEKHGELFSSPDPRLKITGEPNSMSLPGKVFPRTRDDGKKCLLEYDLIPILHPAFILRKDSYNPETKKFSKGGFADQTSRDLSKIKSLVDTLKQNYETTLRFIERT